MQPDDRADRHFILQQGLPEPGPGSCTVLAGALLFQPRLIGVIVVVLTVLQSAHGFLGLAFALWYNALLPAENPFDAVYRALQQGKPDAAVLPSAAPPRRFAQALAGTMAAFIGVAIVRGWWTAAYAVEAILLVAIAALSLGRFCLGSFLYYILRGKVGFAIRTLPWGRGTG